MNREEIATTYEEYKNGAKQVAGLGRLSCYQGLDYLEKLLEKDKFYSEQLEDTIVFIESHINRIEKENQKYKEVINKLKNKTKENIENAKCEITTLTTGDKAYYQYIEKILDNYVDILKEVD